MCHDRAKVVRKGLIGIGMIGVAIGTPADISAQPKCFNGCFIPPKLT